VAEDKRVNQLTIFIGKADFWKRARL